MLKKMSLRLRLTVLSIALLTVCCVCLTAILNLSANQMANVIEAVPITPAIEAKAGEVPTEGDFAAIEMQDLVISDNSLAARRSFLFQSIAYMILVVAVGGGLTYYLAGRALKPLHEMSAQMKNRTVQNLSERLPIPQSEDEIADLTSSFNEMSTKLDGAFEAQKRFSQSAAHELRTPLTVLKTKVDVFKKKPNHTAEEYDGLLSVITTHTNRLSDLVKELLEFTNMDALSRDEEILLERMLDSVVEELSMLAKEKQISVKVMGEGRIAMGNSDLLHRAFYNLIENAIKYNVEGGEIKIVLSGDGERSVIAIADTGIGIPTAMQPHIFEPFYRVDKSRSRQMGGAGLGLATVQSIINKHGGEVSVSDNVGGGTVFEVKL